MKTIFDYLQKIFTRGAALLHNHAITQTSDIATATDVADTVGIAVDNDDAGKSISPSGINLITSFEDLKLEAYDDGTGTWTIGFGTTAYPDGVRVQKGDRCSLVQANTFFQHDLRRFQNTVNQTVSVVLSQNQFDALVSLSYNIGQHAFKNSTLLKYLNAGNYQAAADQFLVWNKGGGQVLQGLVRRREVEQALFLKS